MQGNFQLPGIHVRCEAESLSQFFRVQYLHGAASAFPLSVQAWGVENSDGFALPVRVAV